MPFEVADRSLAQRSQPHALYLDGAPDQCPAWLALLSRDWLPRLEFITKYTWRNEYGNRKGLQWEKRSSWFTIFTV